VFAAFAFEASVGFVVGFQPSTNSDQGRLLHPVILAARAACSRLSETCGPLSAWRRRDRTDAWVQST